MQLVIADTRFGQGFYRYFSGFYNDFPQFSYDYDDGVGFEDIVSANECLKSLEPYYQAACYTERFLKLV